MRALGYVREFNKRVAEGYDFWPWTYGHPEGLDPVALQLRAKPYGGTGRFDNVLDVGCGTGRLLLEAATRTTGRLVGTDISATTCARARETLAEFGDRAEIVNADIMDLVPEALGQFDLIYCTGVICILLPTVRRQLLELIARCLRPGGAVLISYYSGLGAAVRAHLSKSVRSVARDHSDAAVQTRAGRLAVDELRTAAGHQNQFALGLRAAFRHFDGLEDEMFFAEVINGDFSSTSTVELNRAFQEFGVDFATYVGFSGFNPSYSAVDRALLADRLDVIDGRHRYALFVKPGEIPPEHGRAEPAPMELPVANDATPRPLRVRLRNALRHGFWLVFRI